MKKTLYEDLFERADNYAQSAAKLMECEEDEEYSAVLDEMLAEFDASRTDLADILGTIARIRINLMHKASMAEAQAKSFEAEHKRWVTKKSSAENAAKRLNAAVCSALESIGMEKIRTDIGTWFTKDDVKVEVHDPYAIPSEFVSQPPPKADVNAIKKHFRFTGELIPGVEITPVKGAQFR